MLKVVQGSTLSAIGDAIRTVTMSSATFLPSEMPTAITDMSDWALYRVRVHTIDDNTDVLLSEMYVSVGSQPDAQAILSDVTSRGYIYGGTYRIGANGETMTGNPAISSPSEADVYLDCTRARVRVIQAHVPDYEIEYQDSGYTAVLTFTDDTSFSASGFVFDTNGTACTIREQSRKWQYGTCQKTATLPTIISTGAGRSSYTHNVSIANGVQISANSSVYCFAGMTSGMVNGSQVELTISVSH